MKRLGLYLVTAAMIVWAALPLAAWALDAALFVDGVQGGGTVWDPASIAVEAYSFTNEERGADGTGISRERVRADLSPVTVIKPLDASSPELALKNASGAPISKVELKVYPSSDKGAAPLFTIEMTDVRISEFSNSGGLSGTREAVSFVFAKIRWIFDDGQAKSQAGWDLESNVQY